VTIDELISERLVGKRIKYASMKEPRLVVKAELHPEYDGMTLEVTFDDGWDFFSLFDEFELESNA
jgi:hypothetical protein